MTFVSYYKMYRVSRGKPRITLFQKVLWMKNVAKAFMILLRIDTKPFSLVLAMSWPLGLSRDPTISAWPWFWLRKSKKVHRIPFQMGSQIPKTKEEQNDKKLLTIHLWYNCVNIFQCLRVVRKSGCARVCTCLRSMYTSLSEADEFGRGGVRWGGVLIGSWQIFKEKHSSSPHHPSPLGLTPVYRSSWLCWSLRFKPTRVQILFICSWSCAIFLHLVTVREIL